MAAGPSPACGVRQACADSWPKLICWCDDFARHLRPPNQTCRTRRLAPARAVLRLLAGARTVDVDIGRVHARLHVSWRPRCAQEHSAVLVAVVAAVVDLLGDRRSVCHVELASWWPDPRHAALASARGGRRWIKAGLVEVVAA